jgi:hypothetical protein
MIISIGERNVKTHFNYTYRHYSDGEYEFTWFKEMQLIGRNGGRKLMDENKAPIPQEKKELYRYQARIRAGSNIRQLVKENNLKYMWTLTYAADVTSRETALYDFVKFMKRLSYQIGAKIPYVAVTEVQKGRMKKTGKAVLHFHMAIDRFIDIKKLEKAWKHGYVFVSTYENGKKISGDKNSVASYLSKYLKKDMEENPENEGKKMYLNSQGLKRPEKGHGVVTDEARNEIKEIASNYDINEEISGSNLNPTKLARETNNEINKQIFETIPTYENVIA